MIQISRLLIFVGLSFIATINLLENAQANVGQNFGFGARTAALAGAGVAWGSEGFAAYHNPAALALLTPEHRLTFSYGLIFMKPSFKEIQGVYIENKYVSDKDTVGNIDNDYKSTFGQEIGLSYLVAPEWHQVSLGVAIFVPLVQLASMDTGDSFAPEYVLYRARTQRPQVDLGFAGKFGFLHAGLGLHGSFGLTSQGTIFLQRGSNPSTMRFSSSVKPKLSPYVGFLYAPEDEKSTYTIGLVARTSSSANNTMVLNSGARLLGNSIAFDFRFNAMSTLYYDPATIELGGSWQHFPNMRLYGQLEYQFWKGFESPSLMIDQTQVTSCDDGSTTGSCGFTISPGQNPALSLRNIPVLRIAEEFEFSTGEAIRAGYTYKPSIFIGVPNEAGNYLDPPKHTFSIGVGTRFSHFLSAPIPVKLDANLAYSVLSTQHVVKTPENESGTPSGDFKIGAPGYDAGGKEYGGGISLTLAF